jgi:hypothetical protein
VRSSKPAKVVSEGMVDFDAIAMMGVDDGYPSHVGRLDELHIKEKARTLSDEEKSELVELDKFLLSEFDRIKLHYQFNWFFMERDRKLDLINQAKEWEKNFKTQHTTQKEE